MKPIFSLNHRFTYFFFSIPVWICLSVIGACTTPEASLADKKNYTRDDSQYKRKFEIAFEENEKPLRFWDHYVVSSLPGGYKVRVFHPVKKTLTEEKTYSTAALTLLHGPYHSYWDDGYIRAQGQYQYGRKHGTWLECEPGKGKTSSGPYLNHKKEGIWTQLDTNGLIESVYTWLDGLRHGKFYEYDSNGQKSNEGIYQSDTLVAELFKTPKVQKPYLKACQELGIYDVYTCTESSLIQKVNASLKYPAKARQMGVEGDVLIQWDVMPDGSVQNMRVPQALSEEIEAECFRVLSNMPPWVPAKKDGHAVKWTMSLPVSFRL